MQNRHCVKSVRIRSFSDPYFFVFGLNTKSPYSVHGKYEWVHKMGSASYIG